MKILIRAFGSATMNVTFLIRHTVRSRVLTALLATASIPGIRDKRLASVILELLASFVMHAAVISMELTLARMEYVCASMAGTARVVRSAIPSIYVVARVHAAMQVALARSTTMGMHATCIAIQKKSAAVTVVVQIRARACAILVGLTLIGTPTIVVRKTRL